MLNRLYRAFDALSHGLALLSGVALLGIAAMQIVEIFARNVLNVSLPFVWEYAAYFHMAAIFLAGAYTLRTGGHIRVTLVHQLRPRVFEVIATLLALAISAYLSRALFNLALGYASSGRTSGTVNDVPLVYPAAAVAFGSALLTLQLLLRLIATLRGEPEEIGAPDQAVPAD